MVIYRLVFSPWVFLFAALSFLVVLVSATPALAGGDCTPDAGFEWCYQEASWPPAFCKIQVDTNYNTAPVNGYTVSAKQFAVRFKSSGTTYDGQLTAVDFNFLVALVMGKGGRCGDCG